MSRLGMGLGLMAPDRKAGGGWTPADLGAKLVIWMDASDPATIAESSGLVDAWSNKVGPGNAAVAVTGSKPYLSPTGVAGRPGIVFDGVDDYLRGANSFTGANTLGVAREYWALASQNMAGAVTSTRYLLRHGDSQFTRNQMARVGSGGVSRARATSSNGTAESSHTGTIVDFTGPHILRSVVSATGISLSVDGVDEGGVSLTPISAVGDFVLGGQNTTTAFFDGAISQVLVTSPLTLAESAALLSYLNDRRL